MKMWQLDISEYINEVDQQVYEKSADGKIVPKLDERGIPKRERVSERFCVKFEFPRILCNPSIGSDEYKKKDGTYDITKIGPVAHKISVCPDEKYILLTPEDKKVLEKRVEEIGPYLGFSLLEMVLRVQNMREVDVDVNLKTAKE